MKLRELRHNKWNIGFIEEGLDNTLNNEKPNIHWVKKRFNDRWFADPFILDVTDSEIIILAEEYCYDIRKGRIARVVIDRNTYEERNFEIILELPTHLSFPFVLRRKDKVFLIPENSASGCSTVYEYEDSTRSIKALNHVSAEPFTDAIVFEIRGNHYLMTTMIPDQNGKVLSLYEFNDQELKADKKLTEFTFDSNIARNAGAAFTKDGNIYRPAQDCNKCYGHGVILQKFSIEANNVTFINTNNIYPCSFLYNQGIHTFNHFKGLIVVDARGYRNPILGRILTLIKSCLKYFK